MVIFGTDALKTFLLLLFIRQPTLSTQCEEQDFAVGGNSVFPDFL